MRDPARILVAQTIYLGDVILTLPLLDALRRRFLHSEIDILVQKGEARTIVEGHRAIDSVLEFDKDGVDRGVWGAICLSRRLRRRRYDAAIVLPGSIRTAVVVFLAKIPFRVGSSAGSELFLFSDLIKFPGEIRHSPGGRASILLRWLCSWFGRRDCFPSILYTHTVDVSRALPAARRHLELISPFGSSPTVVDETTPVLEVREELRQIIDDILLPLGKRAVIALAPGSTWHTKRWPIERYVSLAALLAAEDFGIVLIGGADDKEHSQHIAKRLGPRCVDSCGVLTVRQSAELIRKCAALVTNDSAPAHLAVAVGTPCVTILGPTAKEFGFAWHKSPHMCIETANLQCRPCTPHGGNICPTGTHECMTSIHAETVFVAVQQAIHQRSGRASEDTGS